MDPISAFCASDPGLLDPNDFEPERRGRLIAWLCFQRAFGPRPATALAALRKWGDPARALAFEGKRRKPVDDDLAALVRCRARVSAMGSSSYPRCLEPLPDAPPLLYVRGRPEALAGPAVAIVGARSASTYGLGVARRLARGLAERSVTIVSGLARGVDAAAHQGALDVGGCTVAIQACGPDLVYPPEHALLADAIEERGAIVTEFPVATPPLAYHFPLRNRLISGLSALVVVVEARPRSGSLHTARHALEQGVEVMAVPGPIDRVGHRGSNGLLRDGAAPVLGLEDVVDRLEQLPPAPASQPPKSPPPSAEARRILDALAAAPAGRDELLEAIGCPPGELAQGLLELEIQGRVQRERDGCWRRVDPEDRAP